MGVGGKQGEGQVSAHTGTPPPQPRLPAPAAGGREGEWEGRREVEGWAKSNTRC